MTFFKIDNLVFVIFLVGVLLQAEAYKIKYYKKAFSRMRTTRFCGSGGSKVSLVKRPFWGCGWGDLYINPFGYPTPFPEVTQNQRYHTPGRNVGPDILYPPRKDMRPGNWKGSGTRDTE